MTGSSALLCLAGNPSVDRASAKELVHRSQLPCAESNFCLAESSALGSCEVAHSRQPCGGGEGQLAGFRGGSAQGTAHRDTLTQDLSDSGSRGTFESSQC